MAFVTYILLYGLCLGVYHRFTPEDLTITGSSSMIVLALELLAMKMAFFLVGDVVTAPSLWDLLAYCSYIFVGYVLVVACGVVTMKS